MSDEMDFSMYQHLSKEFDKTANKDFQVRLTHYISGAAEEGGEIAGKLKRLMRGEGELQTFTELRDAILPEVGDELWYLAQICTLFEVNMSDVAMKNIEKLTSRAARGKLSGSGDDR